MNELETYQFQLEQVIEALEKDPENQELLQLKSDISELISLYSLSTTSNDKNTSSSSSKNSHHKDHKNSNNNNKKNENSQSLSNQHQKNSSSLSHELNHQAVSSTGNNSTATTTSTTTNKSNDNNEMRKKRKIDQQGEKLNQFNIGETVMAKYSADGKYYEAVISTVPTSNEPHSSGSGNNQHESFYYTVVYSGYGTIEHLKEENIKKKDQVIDGVPIFSDSGKSNSNMTSTNGNPANSINVMLSADDAVSSSAVTSSTTTSTTGTIKSKKSAYFEQKKLKMEAEEKVHSKKQQSWQSFAKGNKKLKGVSSVVKGKSIFATPDNPHARVGVMGSGKPMTNFTQRTKHKY